MSFSVKFSWFGAFLLVVLSCSFSLAAQTPPVSTFFTTVSEEAYSTVQMTPGTGDLWPSCWADDGNLYAANGDGTGFGSTFEAMVVNKISGTPSEVSGTPSTLSGSFVAGDVGMNYTGSSGYTDKPTGMLCINGDIYLAFQNLNESTFEYAPAAAIVESTDHGATWSTPPSTPMFGSADNTNPNVPALFTTVMFLDFGQNSGNAIDGYVYAYGLDQNWRDQQNVYLARVPAGSVLTASAWQFFTGMSGSTPTWSSTITQKVPVITDTRAVNSNLLDNTSSRCGTSANPLSSPVIGQGGAVYDAPLKRFLFTSWSCGTHEIYEAPEPWGPWSHIAPSATVGSTAVQPSTTDFGPWLGTYNRGQYGTTIPSKFISSDGHSMWLQSNVCYQAAAGDACEGNSYTFSLRQLVLGQPTGGSPTNGSSNQNLAMLPGTTAISKSEHFGSLCGPNCAAQLSSGNFLSEDDADNQEKTTDWWGYTWPQPYNMNEVVYETGNMFTDGGWFASNLEVQVRQNGEWINTGATVSPAYPYSSSAGAQTTYTFTFPSTWGDGVRIIGTPGGASYFTSIQQLAVTYGSATSGLNLVQDPGFEQQTTGTVSSPWSTEGPDNHGIDINLGFAHTGLNDGWIRDSTTNWNAITQLITVAQNTTYSFTASIQNNFSTNIVYCGVRDENNNVVEQTETEAAPQYVTQSVSFNSGTNTSMRVFCGFWGTGSDQWARIDDVSVH